MNSPLFTIVIPCYNAEAYLEEAVCSVLGQAFSDFEVLIVNDASTDGSLTVARKCADYDSRVRIVDLEENGGASEARNRGIAEAAGKYIMFLDSDDIYAPRLFERVAAAAADEPDVIIWGAKEEYRDADDYIKKHVSVYCPEKRLTAAQEVREQVMMLEKRSLYGYLWNKAYRASLIKDIRIPKQPFNEDEMFNMNVFWHVLPHTAVGQPDSQGPAILLSDSYEESRGPDAAAQALGTVYSREPPRHSEYIHQIHGLCPGAQSPQRSKDE